MIHPTAQVHATARIAEDAEIGAYCVVGAHSEVGARSRLLPHSIVGDHTVLGENNELHPGAVVGGPPQDKSFRSEPTRLTTGSDNVFRECVTINRGTVKGGGLTVVGDRNLFMACSHVGHDCRVGSDIVLSNAVLLAGHIEVGDRAILGGAVAAHHFVRIGRMAYLGGMTRCVHDVPPFCKVSGDPGRVRALNVVGLERGGASEEEIDLLRDAFAAIYRTDQPLRTALRGATAQNGTMAGELLRHLHDWAKSPKGRYLEQFRTDRKEAGR